MMYLVLLLFACLAVFPAWGKDAAAEAAKYESCMKLAHSAPQKAFATALDWRSRGGAHPAEHCAAVALVGLKRYVEAAEKFETLAAGMEKAPPKLRAQVLDQAGQAWLLAGNAPRAYEALSDALRAAPGDPGLLTDRAEAAAARGRYQDAVDDLSRALA
jgi:tetratricopeptide (TPR) repeat protein